MNRILLRLLVPALATALLSAAAACSTSVEEPAGGTATQGTGGSTTTTTTTGTQGTGGAGVCQLDPKGSFTFHVHNAGTKMLRLALGCGATLPIDLVTPEGTLSIGPGGVGNTCEFTCDEVYGGGNTGECSDCGPGVSADLSPGVTADIQWDRRVYVDQMVVAQCAPDDPEGVCAFGEAVKPSAAQSGVLTTCDDTAASQSGIVGSCATGSTAAVSFTLDTTQAEGTIEVQ